MRNFFETLYHITASLSSMLIISVVVTILANVSIKYLVKDKCVVDSQEDVHVESVFVEPSKQLDLTNGLILNGKHYACSFVEADNAYLCIPTNN